MPVQTDESPDEDVDDRPTVTAHASRSDRTVFTEQGNKEAWISTNLTVERWR
jgi:hypothetical protein